MTAPGRPNQQVPTLDYKKLLFGLIRSLALSDHMGDVCTDVFGVLKQCNIDTSEFGDLSEASAHLETLGYETFWSMKQFPPVLAAAPPPQPVTAEVVAQTWPHIQAYLLKWGSSAKASLCEADFEAIAKAAGGVEGV
jgi:hypothetical protein